MKNTFKVLFYVKRNAVKKTGKAPIIARITVDQAISQFNTQLEIDRRYELTRRRIEEFIKYKYSVSDMPLKDINVLFVENFLLFNENVHGCNHNTAMKFVQRLRTVVNFAKNTGMLFVDPFGNFKVKFERTDRGYLTMEEIMAIYHHTFPSRRLEQVRDLFIFSCFTALSYIDVCELQPDDISTGFDGNLWIIRKRHKTKVTASIRLLDIPIAILKKYKGFTGPKT